MDTGRDSAGNPYSEFDMSDEERIRVTRIRHAAWASGPTIRIQKRQASGKLANGPEFPADRADHLIEAVRSVTQLAEQ